MSGKWTSVLVCLQCSLSLSLHIHVSLYMFLLFIYWKVIRSLNNTDIFDVLKSFSSWVVQCCAVSCCIDFCSRIVYGRLFHLLAFFKTEIKYKVIVSVINDYKQMYYLDCLKLPNSFPSFFIFFLLLSLLSLFPYTTYLDPLCTSLWATVIIIK